MFTTAAAVAAAAAASASSPQGSQAPGQPDSRGGPPVPSQPHVPAAVAAAVAAPAEEKADVHGGKVLSQPHVPAAAAAAVAAPVSTAKAAGNHQHVKSGFGSDKDNNKNAAVGGHGGSSSSKVAGPCQQQGPDRPVLGVESETRGQATADSCMGAGSTAAAAAASAVAAVTEAPRAGSHVAEAAAALRDEDRTEAEAVQGDGAGGVGADADAGAAEGPTAAAASTTGAAAAAAVAATPDAPTHGHAESTDGGRSGPRSPPAKQQQQFQMPLSSLPFPAMASSYSHTPRLGSSSDAAPSPQGLLRNGGTGSTDERPSPTAAAAAATPELELPTTTAAPEDDALPAHAQSIASGAALPLPLLSQVAFHGAPGEYEDGWQLQQVQQMQQQQQQKVVPRAEEPEPTPFTFHPAVVVPEGDEPCFAGLPFGELLEPPEPTPQTSPLNKIRLLRGAMLDAQVGKQQQQEQQQLVPRARARSVDVPRGAAAPAAMPTLGKPYVERTSAPYGARGPLGNPESLSPLLPTGPLQPMSGWHQAPSSTTPSGTIARLEGGPMAPMLAAAVLGERKFARRSVNQRLYDSARAGGGGGRGSSGGNQSWSGAESDGQQHHTRTVSGPCPELPLAGPAAAAHSAYHGPTSAGAHSADLHRIQPIGLGGQAPAPQRAGPAMVVATPLSGSTRRGVTRRPSRLSLDHHTSRPAALQRVTGPLPVSIPEVLSSGPAEAVQDAAANTQRDRVGTKASVVQGAGAAAEGPGGPSGQGARVGCGPEGPLGLRRLQAWLFAGRKGASGLTASRAASSFVERRGQQGQGLQVLRMSEPGQAGIATAAAAGRALGQQVEEQQGLEQREVADFLAMGYVRVGLEHAPNSMLTTRALLAGGSRSMMTAHSSPLPGVSSCGGGAAASPCNSGQATPLRTSRTAASPAAIAAAAIMNVAQSYSNKLIKLPEASPVMQGAGEEVHGPEPGRRSAPGTSASMAATGDNVREARPRALAAVAPHGGFPAVRMSYGGPFGGVGAEQEGARSGSAPGSRRLLAKSSGRLDDQQLQLIHVQLQEQMQQQMARAVGTASGSAGPASIEVIASGGDTLAELPDSQPPQPHARWPRSFQLPVGSSASVPSSTAGPGAGAVAGASRLLGPAVLEDSVTSSRGLYGGKEGSSMVAELTRGASSKVLGLAAEAVATPSLYRDSCTLTTAMTMGPSGPLGLSSGMSVTGVPYGVHLSYRGSSSVTGVPSSVETPTGGAPVGAGVSTAAGRQQSGGGGVSVPGGGGVTEEGGKGKGGLAKAKGLLKKVARVLGVKGGGSAR